MLSPEPLYIQTPAVPDWLYFFINLNRLAYCLLMSEVNDLEAPPDEKMEKLGGI